MPYSTLVAINRSNTKRADYTNPKAEDEYYTQYQDATLAFPIPAVPLARIRIALIAFRNAFATYHRAH